MHFLKLLTGLFLFLLSNTLLAQNAVYKKVTERISKTENPLQTLFLEFPGARKSSSPNPAGMLINAPVLNHVLKSRPELLSLSFPLADGSLKIVDVLWQEIHTNDFRIRTSENSIAETGKELFYRGVVRGVENSLVVLSFTDRGASGYISDETGDYQIVKTETEDIYRLQKPALSDKPMLCGTPDDSPLILRGVSEVTAIKSTGEMVGCRPVTIYFEADYTLYQRLGSVQATIDYVNLLFSRVAVVFENEGIDIRLSGIKVWEIPTPYNDLGYVRNDILFKFLNTLDQKEYNADLAHLLYGAEFGGVAFLNVLGGPYNAALSGVSGNEQHLDRDIKLVAHELGHNFGSFHTHSCAWPGGPIDGCAAPEGDCTGTGEIPADGGTIMSYCPVINLAKGFGPLPGAVIRKNMANFAGSKVIPVNLETQEASRSHARLSWEHPFINTAFTLEYKEQGANAWVTLNTKYNQVEIRGLKPSTTYDWRVKAVCSEYAVSTFKTSDQVDGCRPYFQTASCESGHLGIRSFSIDERKILFENQCSPDSYSFHMREETVFRPGKEYTFTIEYSLSGFYSAIWLDLNGNGQWEEEERLYLSDRQETLVNTGKIRIPENIRVGITTRMRIIIIPSYPPVSSCIINTWGEAQDYLVSIPDCEDQLSPPQNLHFSNSTGTTVDVNWEFHKNNLFKIDYRKNGSSEWIISYDSATRTRLKDLSPLTTYEVRVSTACSDYAYGKFTTTLSEYCGVTHSYKNRCTDPEILGIQRITFPGAGLDKTKNCMDSAYQLFDHREGNFQAGRSYEFTVTPYVSWYHVQLGIWIDLDGNGVFEDHERLFLGYKKFDERDINGVIHIPAGMTPLKKIRMRVIVNNSHSQAPCGEQTSGETMDFDVSVQPSCPNMRVDQFQALQPTACTEGLLSFATNIKNQETVRLRYLLDDRENATDLLVHNSLIELADMPGGHYTFVSAQYGDCTVSLDAGIRVNTPSVSFATADNTGPYLPGETIRLSGGGGVSYQWQGPGGYYSHFQNPDIYNASLTDAGKYTVMVTDKDKCLDQATTEVEVNPILSKEPDHRVSVYPNPVSETLTIKTSLKGQCQATLWSASGKQVKRITFTGDSHLKIDKLPPGVYTLKVQNEETETGIKVIIL